MPVSATPSFPPCVSASAVASAYAARIFDMSDACLELSSWAENTGMAIATRTAMMATTIRSSGSVKPLLVFFMTGSSFAHFHNYFLMQSFMSSNL